MNFYDILITPCPHFCGKFILRQSAGLNRLSTFAYFCLFFDAVALLFILPV